MFVKQPLVRALRTLADEIERRGVINVGVSGTFDPVEGDPIISNGISWATYQQGPHRVYRFEFDFIKDEFGQDYPAPKETT